MALAPSEMKNMEPSVFREIEGSQSSTEKNDINLARLGKKQVLNVSAQKLCGMRGRIGIDTALHSNSEVLASCRCSGLVAPS